MAGCDSHTSHVDKKCINTAGALIIELRRLYNHRITQSQQTQTNQHRDPKRPKRRKEMPSRAWIWLASYLRKRRCTGPRSQNRPSPSWMSAPPEKKNTATLASDVFECIRLSLVGSAFGFLERGCQSYRFVIVHVFSV